MTTTDKVKGRRQVGILQPHLQHPQTSTACFIALGYPVTKVFVRLFGCGITCRTLPYWTLLGPWKAVPQGGTFWEGALKTMLKVAGLRLDRLLLVSRMNSPHSAQLLRRSSYSSRCCRMRNTNPIRPNLPS